MQTCPELPHAAAPFCQGCACALLRSLRCSCTRGRKNYRFSHLPHLPGKDNPGETARFTALLSQGSPRTAGRELSPSSFAFSR